MRNRLVENELAAAFDAEPDYSETFTRNIEALGAKLSSDLRVPVRHDADMNYSSSQKLVADYSANGEQIEPSSPECKFRLIVYISSKGPYFATKLFALRAIGNDHLEYDLPSAGDYWIEANGRNGLPAKMVESASQITEWMQSQSYQLIDGESAGEIAEGHQTDLDGSPATVFDVLFSEIE